MIACVVSLLAHPLVLALFLLASHWWPKAPHRPKPQHVSLRSLDARQWAANRGRASMAVPEPEAPLHPRGQVVDVAEGNHQLAPDAKFLAESDNRVRHETHARDQTSHYSVAAPKNAPDPMAMPAARGRAGGRAAEPVSLASQAERFASLGGLLPQPEEVAQPVAQGQADSNADSNDLGGRANSEGQAEHGAEARAAEGGGAPNDDLRGVDQGDATYLNTREWKYAAFFNRVKQAVAARWDPNGRVRAKDPRGEHTGYTDRITQLQVALRPDGSLADVYVAKSCGLDWLDQEAVQAFEHAQPFANPPQALVENGYIRFGFGFSLVNEGLGPQLFHFPRR